MQQDDLLLSSCTLSLCRCVYMTLEILGISLSVAKKDYLYIFLICNMCLSKSMSSLVGNMMYGGY